MILCDVQPGGAAALAGLKPDDVVLSVDGRSATGAGQLRAAIFQHEPGETVRLTVARGEERTQVPVRVTEQSSAPTEFIDLAARNGRMIRALGILGLDLTDDVRSMMPELQRTAGVVAAAIPAELDGANPGLEVGDVVYEINGHRVETGEDLLAQLALKKPGEAVALLVESRGTLGYVTFWYE